MRGARAKSLRRLAHTIAMRRQLDPRPIYLRMKRLYRRRVLRVA